MIEGHHSLWHSHGEVAAALGQGCSLTTTPQPRFCQDQPPQLLQEQSRSLCGRREHGTRLHACLLPRAGCIPAALRTGSPLAVRWRPSDTPSVVTPHRTPPWLHTAPAPWLGGLDEAPLKLIFAFFSFLDCRVPASARPHQNHPCTGDRLPPPTKHVSTWEKNCSQNPLTV